MLYAVLCYNDESAVGAWTKEEDDACMAQLAIVQDKVAAKNRMGPVARLLPTTSATEKYVPTGSKRKAFQRNW